MVKIVLKENFWFWKLLEIFCSDGYLGDLIIRFMLIFSKRYEYIEEWLGIVLWSEWRDSCEILSVGEVCCKICLFVFGFIDLIGYIYIVYGEKFGSVY